MHFLSPLIFPTLHSRCSGFKLWLGGIHAVSQQFLTNSPHDFDISDGDSGSLAVYRNQVGTCTIGSLTLIHCTFYSKMLGNVGLFCSDIHTVRWDSLPRTTMALPFFSPSFWRRFSACQPTLHSTSMNIKRTGK